MHAVHSLLIVAAAIWFMVWHQRRSLLVSPSAGLCVWTPFIHNAPEGGEQREKETILSVQLVWQNAAVF